MAAKHKPKAAKRHAKAKPKRHPKIKPKRVSKTKPLKLHKPLASKSKILKKEKASAKPAKEVQSQTEGERMKAAVEKVLGKTERAKQIAKQREPILEMLEKAKPMRRVLRPGFVRTGIFGVDELLVDGVPKGASVLVAGGPGSGKTILALQICYETAKAGKKALYLSFEESEQRLMNHMKSFGWDVDPLIHKGLLKISRVFPLDIKRSVDALLAKAKGELMIDVPPIILPNHFQPDVLVIDSLTAIASTFVGTEETYRIYIEQLFRFLENIEATSFLITETETLPAGRYSASGVEEFLADGVIVLYNIRKGSVRESAIEVLKMRGVDHKKRIVAVRITNKGMEVFPEQEVFGEIA